MRFWYCLAWVFFCLFTGTACTNNGPGARYYFPVDELNEGLVYAYQNVADPDLAPYYWYYRSVETPDSTALTATFYDTSLEPRQFVNERIVSTGSLLRELRLFQPTDSASITTVAQILAPALFSFESPDSSLYLTSRVRWQQPAGSTAAAPPVYELTRRRHYLYDTTYRYKNKNYPAQLWQSDETIKHDSLGVLTLQSTVREIYAAGIGLVDRQRTFDDGSREHYRLYDRFGMDSLEARFSR